MKASLAARQSVQRLFAPWRKESCSLIHGSLGNVIRFERDVKMRSREAERVTANEEGEEPTGLP